MNICVKPQFTPETPVMLMGDFGETRDGKDGEIRVRTGKFTERPTSRRGAATSVFCRGTLKIKDLCWLPERNTDPNTVLENSARS